MKKFFFLILLFCTAISVKAQIAKYNHFPTMKPYHVLDDKLDDISFAFSMRVLNSDYDGPLVRLRRAGDNAELDFGWGDNDIVDIDAINDWRGTNNVFIRTWYDQSGLGRNAVQTTRNRQPRFFTNTTIPFFRGDGINDHLTVNTPNGIQDVTNNGNQGTVVTNIIATRRSQHTFGVLRNGNRWSTHISWSDNNLYFDPGVCCNNPRSFNNASNINNWEVYSFIKTNTNVIARSGGVQRFNGTHTKGRCTITDDFSIGWATGNQTNNHSNNSFNELIMYRTNIATIQIQEIEENTQVFWSF